MVIFRKNVFSALIMKFFGQKQKYLNAGKIREYYDKKVFFWGEKRFHLSKLHRYQFGKAQIMPVVAGRFFLFELKPWTLT